MSDHSISCAIVNLTSEALALTARTQDDGTTFQLAGTGQNIPVSSGGEGTPAFTASHSWASGCGGTATYRLPNGDALVIAYSTSHTTHTSSCIPLLQSGSGNAGTDEYFCTATNAVVLGQDDGVTATITVQPQKQSEARACRT
jgi:hypothetical protein